MSSDDLPITNEPDEEVSAMAIAAKVAARATEIEAKAGSRQAASKPELKLDKRFVLDCLSRRRGSLG